MIQRFGLKSKRATSTSPYAPSDPREDQEISPTHGAALELEGMWADMTDEEAREIWREKFPTRMSMLDR